MGEAMKHETAKQKSMKYEAMKYEAGEKRVDYKPEELIPIVAKLSRKMTGEESTSITYEKAQQLMEAVLYCIREWEREQECGDTAWEKISAEKAYELGFACVNKKVALSLALYNKIMERFDSYGNRCLYDTVVKGIPEFFKWYDVRLEPQNTILTLDYPVMADLREYTGVDAIWEYLCCIREEQRYLGKFPQKFVVEMLRSYCADYEDMVENLRQIVDDYCPL